MEVSTLDLFCGAGGLTYGFEQAGLSVAAGIDKDSICRYPYEQNTSARFVQCDLEPVANDRPERVDSLFEFGADVKVLAGCPPCQPYSALTHGEESFEHDKGGLVTAFDRLVEHVGPDVVVMENVIEVRNDGDYKELVEGLEDRGYWVNDEGDRGVDCWEYGIPQKRKRWVTLASRLGPIQLGEPEVEEDEGPPTIRETIDHLPAIEAGETHPYHELHHARNLESENLERIELMEPGADWRIWREKGREDLLLDCHKKASGSTYKAPYGRMVPDEPAPTITTQFYNYGSGKFGHYDTDQNRALSFLEGALLQTFPRDYDFVEDMEDVSFVRLGELIGNAVPPKLAELIGERIVSHLAAEGVTPDVVRADD